jgi:hypothetical protein
MPSIAEIHDNFPRQYAASSAAQQYGWNDKGEIGVIWERYLRVIFSLIKVGNTASVGVDIWKGVRDMYWWMTDMGSDRSHTVRVSGQRDIQFPQGAYGVTSNELLSAMNRYKLNMDPKDVTDCGPEVVALAKDLRRYRNKVEEFERT